jgi:hypothetical protein
VGETKAEIDDGWSRCDHEPSEPEVETPAADERHQESGESPGVESGAAGAYRQHPGPKVEAAIGDLVARRLKKEAEQ